MFRRLFPQHLTQKPGFFKPEGTKPGFWPQLLILIIACVLTACGGGATPQLIGAYPRGSETGAYTSSEGAPMNTLVVYNAYLELEVYDVGSAAERAKQLAYDYGGYLASSQSWYQGDEQYATLTLAVPVAHYDDLRDSLLRLGTLKSESTSGELINTYDGSNGWNTFSNITVQLRPASIPGRTVEAASSWIAGVVSFIAHVATVLFWIAVVVAPPFFMVVGIISALRWLINRFRRP
jgi:hypothetical protein